MSALVASLFAVGASPAHGDVIGADDSKAEASNKAQFEACVGDALEDQGFTDLGSLEATAVNINCLAYYGITVGKTADTFAPNDNVTRSEMALFLYRAAGLMGVDLMGGDMMADFGDVSELGEDRQNAIKALARNGILDGRGDMGHFYPNADITRAEMAVALVTLIDHVSDVVSVAKSGANKGLFVLGSDGTLPGDHFADARATQPIHVDNAISAAYELGITSGTGGGNFSPSWSVPRRDMATFIIRALNHSNVRPAGLTAQVSTRPMGAAEVVVSVRDADFAPVANAPIDAFRASAAQEDKAFRQNGSCSSLTSLVDGGTKCEIDGADPVTRTDGNVGLGQLTDTEIGEDGLTVWLWTGDEGDEFGNDTDALEISVDPQPQMAASATKAAISSDLGLKGTADARYSQTVTVTIQLQDAEGNDAATPEDGVKYTLVKETYSDRVDHTGDGPDDGVVADNPVARSTETLAVGDDGSVAFLVNARDLDPDNDSEVTIRYTLTRTVTYDNSSGSATQPPLLVPAYDSDGGDDDDAPTVDATTASATTATDTHRGVVVFSDKKARVTSVSVDASSHQSAPSGSNPVGTAATVTVLDQYGRPMSDQGIVLKGLDGSTSITSSRPRFTGPNGQVRIGYRYSGGAAVQTLTAIWDGDTADASDDSNDDLDPGSGEGQEDDTDCSDADSDPGKDICGSTTVFWVGVVTDASSADDLGRTFEQGDLTGPADVLSHDADNQQIVIDSDDDADDDAGRAPSSMSYDSNDFFQVDDSPTTMAEFAEMLDEALAAFEDSEEGSPAEPTIEWSGYVSDDSSSATWFRLTSNLGTNAPS